MFCVVVCGCLRFCTCCEFEFGVYEWWAWPVVYLRCFGWFWFGLLLLFCLNRIILRFLYVWVSWFVLFTVGFVVWFTMSGAFNCRVFDSGLGYLVVFELSAWVCWLGYL